jgi:hypothetical protein
MLPLGRIALNGAELEKLASVNASGVPPKEN